MNERKPVLLAVDDVPENLALLSALLREDYKVKVATSGAAALNIVMNDPPDLILLDVMMPEMDGYEVCRRLKEQPRFRDIPVIFLTAQSDTADEQRGFDLGAVDYIRKPVSPPIVQARVKTHLTLKLSHDFLTSKNAFLEAEIQRRIQELSLVQEAAIVALASLAESRDNETGAHILRTQHYLRELARQLGGHEQYRDCLTREYVQLMFQSAPLHDVGKVGIPDNILLKPGRLTTEEFEVMKRHTTIGRDAMVRAEKLLQKPDSFFSVAREMAYSHHEKWDGSGYPEGLAAASIPVAARLMAVADVYDALISKRGIQTGISA